MVPLHLNLNVVLEVLTLMILVFALPEPYVVLLNEVQQNGHELDILGVLVLGKIFGTGPDLLRLEYSEKFFQQMMEELSIAVLREYAKGLLCEEEVEIVDVFVNAVGRKSLSNTGFQILLELQTVDVDPGAIFLRENEVED